jgi:cholesterol oxidase
LLLRARDEHRTLPRLSPMLGLGFSANGDFLGAIQGAENDLAPNHGPDVTSVMRFCDDAPEFTLAAPTFSAPVMKFLAAMDSPSARMLRPFAPLLWRLLPAALPWLFAHGVNSLTSRLNSPDNVEWRRSTNLFAIGRDNAGGRIHLNRRGLEISWQYGEENAQLIARMQTAMDQLAESYGGTFSPRGTWDLFRRITTVHPLGGCRLSTSPSTGVVSPNGEVHGYPGLFVSDGSVVPTALGFHPVMTICALAERTADAVAASY